MFAAGGNIFEGIKSNVGDIFTGVVDKLRVGLNAVIAAPFQTINAIMNKIRDLPVIPNGLWDENPLPIPEIPALAKGGLATAPTLAMVGDNRNAKTDPEVISPLSKLQGMLDSGSSSEIVQLLREILAFLKEAELTVIGKFEMTTLYRAFVKLNQENTKMTGVNAFG